MKDIFKGVKKLMMSVNLSEFIEYIKANFLGRSRWYNEKKLKSEQKTAIYNVVICTCLLLLFTPIITNNNIGKSIVYIISFIFITLFIMEQRKSKKYSINNNNQNLLRYIDRYNQKVVIDKLRDEDYNVKVIKPLINEIVAISHPKNSNAGKVLSLASPLGITTLIGKMIYSFIDKLGKDSVLNTMLFLSIFLFIVSIVLLLYIISENINNKIPMTYILMILRGINISAYSLKTNYYLRRSVLEKISEENKKKLEDLTKVLDTYMSSEKDISKERKNMSEEEKKLFKEIKNKLEADNKKDL
ncbi:hypothetical protein FC92_GL001050 [Liquorilactobacillus hordei DSM 19519]|uniref:Uncharacterized protein n=3 Tax=Liquorilactobacillus hordei TaxID=468911 RepID=A0A0R1MIX4_9LACO|nr:hypothetical protein FC92_GL001050 [Liquorilactobacillus hordei DSM 19519]